MNRPRFTCRLGLRSLVLCLGALLAVVPLQANAGITQISGTGPNGALANVAYTSSGSLGQNITAAVGAGKLVAVLVQSYDTSPTLSCSDAVGNTWQAAPNGAFRASAATQIWYSFTTNSLANGSTITCTASAHSGGFTTEILGFSGASAYDVAATAATGSASSATVGASPTLTCVPGGGTGCEVCITGIIWNSTGTITSDATWTAVGNNGSSGSWANGFKIVTANTALSFTGSTTASQAYAGAMACFKAAPPRMLMNAVP